MRALNAVGSSPFSDTLVVIAGTIPSKTPTPEKFYASVDSIEIRWSPPSDGGSTITDYRVFWDSGVGGNVFDFKASTGGYLAFTVPINGSSETLIAGRSYQFKVSAVNDVGEGERSNAVSIIAASKPEQPPQPTLVYQSPTQINIEWAASADGGSEITDYIVLSDIGGSGSFTPLSPTTGSKLIRNYAITQVSHGIQAGELYSFKIVAVNAVEESDASEALQVMAAQVADPPINLLATSASDISITIEWTSPAFNGGTPVTDYKIYWNAGVDNGNFELL